MITEKSEMYLSFKMQNSKLFDYDYFICQHFDKIVLTEETEEKVIVFELVPRDLQEIDCNISYNDNAVCSMRIVNRDAHQLLNDAIEDFFFGDKFEKLEINTFSGNAKREMTLSIN